MPEPNLPPLRLRAEQVEGERANLPELGGFLRIIW